MKIILLTMLVSLSITSVIYSQARTQMRYGKDFYTLINTLKCRKCNLYKAPLANLDLTGADISGSNLFKADLRSATLIDANLTGVNLRKAQLSGAVWVDGKVCKPGSIGKCITQ